MIRQKKITKLFLHNSASDVPSHDSIDVIKQWHLERGFEDVGYHFFIRRLGCVQRGRDERYVGAHVRGYNIGSLAICFHGNKRRFSQNQFKSGIALVQHLVDKYGIEEKNVLPHNEVNKNKTCPNFDIVREIKRFIIWPTR